MSTPKNVVMVTGTNGKSSTVDFFRQICELQGLKSASIGTLGVVATDHEMQHKHSGLTTPGVQETRDILTELAGNNIDYVAMEASSHGLAQGRLREVCPKGGAFTNFTRDHLDYHKSMEDYFAAKMRLFTELVPVGGFCVLNSDIPEFPRMVEAIKDRKVLSYGKNGKYIKINEIGYFIEFELAGHTYKIKRNLVGGFQVYNLMCALALAINVGVDKEQAINCLEQIKAPLGRLEEVVSNVFVDYAHNPDALENALLTLRKDCKGRLIVVFGCGGNRDQTKRRKMGEIAARCADIVIVTDDNPRYEDPAYIRKEIMLGCPDALEIPSREEAIYEGIKLLQPGDVLLIAGKGHENYQIIRDEKKPFSDQEVVKQAWHKVNINGY